MSLAGEVILLVVFALVVVFVLWAPRIPIPRCLHFKWVLAVFHDPAANPPVGFHIDLGLAPILGIAILFASLSLGYDDLVFGFAGDATIKPYAIVVLFISLAYVCISLDVTGLLAYIALKAAHAAGSSGRRLFLYTFILSSVFTIVTSNDIVILTLTPVICHFAEVLQIDPVPYLIAQFFAANIWSTMLYIGNPTNIIVALAFDISFVEYSKWMTLPALAAGLSCLGVLLLLFRNRIPAEINASRDHTNPRDKLKDLPGAVFGSVMLVVCLVLIATSFWIGIPVWVVTLVSGALMLVRDTSFDIYRARQTAAGSLVPHARLHDDNEALLPSSSGDSHSDTGVAAGGSIQISDAAFADDTLAVHAEGEATTSTATAVKSAVGTPPPFVLSVRTVRFYTLTETLGRVPWKVIPFVFSMFIMTNGFYNSTWFGTVAAAISSLTSTNVWITVFLMTGLSTVLCNLLNNQPMTILLTRLLQHPSFVSPQCEALFARFALIAGSNFGANFTFLGALAGIMWSKILADRGVTQIRFWTFTKYGVIVMPVVIAASCTVLALQSAWVC